jgi:hypothetical protein
MLSISTVSGIVRLDIGADNTNEWLTTISAGGRISNNSLATAVNAYLVGKTGDSVDIPIKVISPAAGTLVLYNVVAVPKPASEVSIEGAVTVSSSRASSRSGASIPKDTTRYVRGTVKNTGTATTPPFSVSAIADVTGFGPWYIGSVLVPALTVNQSYNVSIPMSTMGWDVVTGTIRLIIDPYDSLLEKNELNNESNLTFEVYDGAGPPPATATKTVSPTRTASNTSVPTLTRTPTKTVTVSRTATVTRVPSTTPTKTATPSRTATRTKVPPTVTRPPTRVPSKTLTRSKTPTRTRTATRTR